MKKQVIVLLMGSIVASTGWAADKTPPAKGGQRATKEESIGIGSGAAIGALGGPVGVILGAAFGGWLGDRFHHERGGRLAAEQRSEEADARASTLEARLASRDQQVAALDSELSGERTAHRRDVQEALSLDVLFRTEDSGLDAGSEQRLAQLAGLIGPMAGAVIRVEGHTDARGTEKYNEALAAARADAVRTVLIENGVPAERIVVSAAGEAGATASEQDTDGMALDRRVAITIVGLDDSGRVAQQN